jgi:predicted phosphoribosyltransferase
MGLTHRFPDRAAAGRELAVRLAEVTEGQRVVLGLPRGGLAIAAPVAAALGAPLAVAWVRRLVTVREPEVVVGAVDIDGDVTLNPAAVSAEGLSDTFVAELATHARERLRQAWARTPGLDPTQLADTTAIVVDDGLTTGLSLIAALRWVRRQLPERVVVAVPVVDRRIWGHVTKQADDAIALEVRDDGPIARSEVYEDFHLVEDQEMVALLRSHAGASMPASV